MPKHDIPVDNKPIEREMSPERAERIEGIAKICAEHLYAKPEDDDVGDNTIWELTSEDNKRIYRSCALDIDHFLGGQG